MITNVAEISQFFPEVEHGYIIQKAMQWQGDFAKLTALAEQFIRTADNAYLDELNTALKFLASPDSPLQLELAYILSKRM
jgi:hypothetical protein